MEMRYPPGIFITLCDCTDPSVAGERRFNHWFDSVLFPHLEGRGLVSNWRRYENVLHDRPVYLGRPKYLALGEVDREDLTLALREIRQSETELRQRGEGCDAVLYLVKSIYRTIGPQFRTERSGQPVQGVFAGLCYCADTNREDEFNTWYNDIHVPDVLALGLYDTAYRFKIADPAPHQATYLVLYETSLDPSEARDKVMSHRSRWQSDANWAELIAPTFTGGFRQIYPGRP